MDEDILSKHLLKHRHICFSDSMRTTIEIRDDLYQKIIKIYGKRKISITINEILTKYFSKIKNAHFFSQKQAFVSFRKFLLILLLKLYTFPLQTDIWTSQDLCGSAAAHSQGI